MKRLVFITPHLSTGGMPQYLLKKIEKIVNDYEIYVIEYSYLSPKYVVQRNKIKDLINFFSLREDKLELIDVLEDLNPDYIWLEEIGETFLKKNELDYIYSKDRKYLIFETSHTSADLSLSKIYAPDKFILACEYTRKQYEYLNIPSDVLEYPIEVVEKYETDLNFDKNYKHIVIVGLFTPGKNQGYAFDIAKRMLEDKVMFHFIGNTAPNFKEYWEPLLRNKPNNCIIHGERDNIFDYLMEADLFLFPSMRELNPIVIKEALSVDELPLYIFNLEPYLNKYDSYDNVHYLSGDITEDVMNIRNELSIIDLKNNFKMGFNKIENIIENTERGNSEISLNMNVEYNHIMGCKATILCNNPDIEFNVRFIKDGVLEYESKLKNGHWAKINRKYCANTIITVENKEHNIYREIPITFTDKRVYISFASKALGDTLAWIPYVDEFRKKHDCEVICSTFHNYLFEESYSDIEFVNPGDVVKNIFAQFSLGWFYKSDDEIDYDKHPSNMRMQPLQKTASDILGLEYKELRPKLKFNRRAVRKKVGIATHATAQCKYWNNPNGWGEVVSYLDSLGYEVVNYSIEESGYMGNRDPDTKRFPKSDLLTLMEDMSECEFFIGLSSGLSWVTWSMGIRTVIISGATFVHTEPINNVYRVINDKVCHGCTNHFRMDPSDWNWCPHFKGTDRQFECSKSITSDMVIDEIRKIISMDKRFGMIVTYYRTTKESEKMLKDMIDIISSENYYIVLASHSVVPVDIINKCDFYFYEDMNIVDDRRYSHGVAESTLLEISLKHMKEMGIEWTYKLTYDVLITDISQFNKWILNYEYNLVTFKWGDTFATNSFFTNIDFLLDNISFFRTIDDMFTYSNVLECAWEQMLIKRGKISEVFIFDSKRDFYGANKVDLIGNNYYDIEFSLKDNNFTIKNNNQDCLFKYIIRDYYTNEIIVEGEQNFINDRVYSYENNYNNINGVYLELWDGNMNIRKNLNISDFKNRKNNHKKNK